MGNNKEKINRKKSFKKLGKYADLTAIGTILLLTPNEVQLLILLHGVGLVINYPKKPTNNIVVFFLNGLKKISSIIY